MCRNRRDFRMRLCEIRRIICVLETWGYCMRAISKASNVETNELHLRLPCTTDDLVDTGPRMSKPGSSSSQPASISGTTPEKEPADIVVTDSKASRPKGFVHATREFVSIPPWVTNNIHKKRSLQTLFRSSLASWAALILLLPTHSLQTIGNLCVQA